MPSFQIGSDDYFVFLCSFNEVLPKGMIRDFRDQENETIYILNENTVCAP